MANTNYLIRNAETKIALRLFRSREKDGSPLPDAAEGEDYIEVPADFSLAPPEGKRSHGWIVVSDKGEKSLATEQDRATALRPKIRPKAQALIDAATALKARAGARDADLAALCDALIDIHTPDVPTEP